jgi:hypothetical protein
LVINSHASTSFHRPSVTFLSIMPVICAASRRIRFQPGNDPVEIHFTICKEDLCRQATSKASIVFSVDTEGEGDVHVQIGYGTRPRSNSDGPAEEGDHMIQALPEIWNAEYGEASIYSFSIIINKSNMLNRRIC